MAGAGQVLLESGGDVFLDFLDDKACVPMEPANKWLDLEGAVVFLQVARAEAPANRGMNMDGAVLRTIGTDLFFQVVVQPAHIFVPNVAPGEVPNAAAEDDEEEDPLFGLALGYNPDPDEQDHDCCCDVLIVPIIVLVFGLIISLFFKQW